MKPTTGILSRWAVLVPALALAACASHAPERFYTVSVPGDAALEQAHAAADRPLIRVARLVLPELINRPQLVLRTGEHEVRILESERWATPLPDDLTRELLADLRRADTDADYLGAGDPRGEDATRLLEVQVDTLDASPGARVHLHASWELRDRARAPLSHGDIEITLQTPAAGDAVQVVQGYGQAMRALAEAIAKGRRELKTSK